MNRAAILAVVAAIAITAPRAHAQEPTSTPTPVATDIAGSEAATLRVLQAPANLGSDELQRIADEVAMSGGAPVIVRVPASATLDAGSQGFAALQEAAPAGHLVVVQQAGKAEHDGAAAALGNLSRERYLQPGAQPPRGAVWGSVDDALSDLGISGTALAAVDDDLTAPAAAAADALIAEAPSSGGGPSPVAVTLVLLPAAGTLAVLALLWSARRRGRPAAGHDLPAPTSRPHAGEPARTVESARPAPAPRIIRPPRTPAGPGRPARVVSVLDPEGYVELDRCLMRVRWASANASPAPPGDWVTVDARGGRLWAFPATRPLRPTAGREA